MAYIVVIKLSSKPEIDMSLFFKYISENRIIKMQSYRYEEDTYRSLLGELLVRYMLCSFLNVQNSELVLKEDGNGKPYLYGRENCYFNISHSKSRVVCILDVNPVGIDVEKIIDIDFESVSSCFHQKERSNINIINRDERKRYFYNLWTIKEAYLKMRGTGLLRALSSFYVIKNQDDKVSITDACYSDTSEIISESIELEDDYFLSYTAFSKAKITYLSDYELFNLVETMFNS